MTLAPGEMLTDNLMLERELGAGGMGTVWLARNCALDSQVAVKVLHDGARTQARRQRFEQEARGLARLDHPNLVKILDYGVSADGEPFIVMERLRGEDLAQRLEREGRLSLETTVHIVEQACRALQHAHAGGVVHRDIKPANLFLSDHDGALHVKVLDFGVARFADGPLEATKTGTLVGTPAFMSPEQLLSPKSVDERSDVWALGVVVYACLTGRLPFEGETPTALGIAVVQTQPPPPTALVAGLPLAIDFFLERALARDLAQRFPSAQALAEALSAASRAPLRPGPANATGATSGSTALASGAVAAAEPAALQAPPAAARPRRARPWRGWLIAVGAVALVGGATYIGVRATRRPPAYEATALVASGEPARAAEYTGRDLATVPALLEAHASRATLRGLMILTGHVDLVVYENGEAVGYRVLRKDVIDNFVWDADVSNLDDFQLHDIDWAMLQRLARDAPAEVSHKDWRVDNITLYRFKGVGFRLMIRLAGGPNTGGIITYDQAGRVLAKP